MVNSKDKGVFDVDQAIPPPGNLDDFMWSTTDEPHATRRKQILAKYPQMKELYGHEPLTKYIVFAVVFLQLALAYHLKDSAFTLYFWVIAYVIGATANHGLFLGIHEISHNLAFPSTKDNVYLAMFCNLPIGIPYSVAFTKYHHEHHLKQGVDGVDTDLPTHIEGVLVHNVLTKTLFCIFQILFYALRPMLVKYQRPTFNLGINWAVQFSFDALVIYFFGWGPIFYFLASDFLAGSLHPMASHFIAEHYVFVQGFETYSYYGPLNMLAFNVGYHNEHHDFPRIPWTRLPKVREAAPEFYDDLPYHDSWPLVIWQFITDPNISAFNRVKRKPKAT